MKAKSTMGLATYNSGFSTNLSAVMQKPKQGRLDYGTYQQPMRFNKSCQNNFFSWKKKQNGHPLFHPLSPSFSGMGERKGNFY